MKKDLVIKYKGDLIYRGEDFYNIDKSLSIKEFHNRLLSICQNKLGMKIDHYLDEFNDFDNLMDDETKYSDINIEYDIHDSKKCMDFFQKDFI